ncbi:hypothetical protein OH738_02775 [Streptomyces hirsutus]|uniref:Uncharacterized protein n=1 Tax=Streptomyces hirsutus TaxID=35620 RepID=A0ABZ1H057_9ACTN|nr:hypothetical protein [Streptomyces hirsutus]WSD10791.1 hypothetical protein OIE73_37250 [Streptomyces hirsutus]WTD15865.1 hypothetical protein OH738_02775 [Streptomyces hirsutus]WTD73199.1 hypothetical protein OHB56_04080 [Streptomyces sp. NBC_01635]
MTDHRHEGPGENGQGIPRDLPDQQAGEGEDPWEVAPGVDEESDPDAAAERQPDVPDTDEAGTGRRGAPHSASADPEQPVPDEPTG